MSAPWIVVAAIIAVAVCYVLLPVVADTFRRFRTKKSLRCPETGTEAEVGIDAGRAALTSAFGRALLRVKNCSLWPERKECAQDCVRSESEVEEARRQNVR
jgi:hypothetical protein